MGNIGNPVTNLRGRRFGQLIVIDWVKNAVKVTKRNGRPGMQGRWKCLCDCGRETLKRGSSLNGNFARSCGCSIEKRMFPMIGKRFGKLVVTEQRESKRYPYKKAAHMRSWLCRCDCGNTRVYTTNALNHDKKAHCGCEAKPRTMKYMRAALAIARVEIRQQVFERMRCGLDREGLDMLTTLDEVMGAQNTGKLRLRARCRAEGHVLDATWINVHMDKACRTCRRDRRNRILRECTEKVAQQRRAERESEHRRRIAAGQALRELAARQRQAKRDERAAIKLSKLKDRENRRMFRQSRRVGLTNKTKQERYRKQEWETRVGLGLSTGFNWTEIRKRIKAAPST